PPSTLFPYTTLFRSDGEQDHRYRDGDEDLVERPQKRRPGHAAQMQGEARGEPGQRHEDRRPAKDLAEQLPNGPRNAPVGHVVGNGITEAVIEGLLRQSKQRQKGVTRLTEQREGKQTADEAQVREAAA